MIYELSQLLLARAIRLSFAQAFPFRLAPFCTDLEPFLPLYRSHPSVHLVQHCYSLLLLHSYAQLRALNQPPTASTSTLRTYSASDMATSVYFDPPMCANIQNHIQCTNPANLVCSSCRLVQYCSKACQTAH
jgi:hypothetical protein